MGLQIHGTYSFDALQSQIWTLLHDPAAIQRALIGCDYFHLHADGRYHFRLNLPSGPYAGTYEGQITHREDAREQTLSFVVNSGSVAAFSGEGSLQLERNRAQTLARYEGHLSLNGRLLAQSSRMAQTTANYFIREFFESIERQCREVLSTSENGVSPRARAVEPAYRRRITAAEVISELRRERAAFMIVLTALLVSVLSLTGFVYFGSRLLRMLGRGANHSTSD